MRILTDSLFGILGSRRRWDRWHASRSFRRPMRPIRPFNPIRGVFHVFWSLLWICFGLAMAFSPQFRGMFIHFWVGFAQVMASFARGLAGLFSSGIQ
jgi:hypothetical protein